MSAIARSISSVVSKPPCKGYYYPRATLVIKYSNGVVQRLYYGSNVNDAVYMLTRLYFSMLKEYCWRDVVVSSWEEMFKDEDISKVTSSPLAGTLGFTIVDVSTGEAITGCLLVIEWCRSRG